MEKDAIKDQPNQYSVQWFREDGKVIRGTEDERDIFTWKGPIEEFYQMVDDSIKWRLYQEEQKIAQRRVRIQEPEYLRDSELLP